MTDGELISEIEAQRGLMITVATGQMTSSITEQRTFGRRLYVARPRHPLSTSSLSFRDVETGSVSLRLTCGSAANVGPIELSGVR